MRRIFNIVIGEEHLLPMYIDWDKKVFGDFQLNVTEIAFIVTFFIKRGIESLISGENISVSKSLVSKRQSLITNLNNFMRNIFSYISSIKIGGLLNGNFFCLDQ